MKRARSLLRGFWSGVASIGEGMASMNPFGYRSKEVEEILNRPIEESLRMDWEAVMGDFNKAFEDVTGHPPGERPTQHNTSHKYQKRSK
jgi:hypothetical protein